MGVHMKNKSSCKKGFTLIELLVVVLIIGILASVALPQYQKAVEKSKAAQALILLRTVYQAANSYYLVNGTWPTSFDELDITPTAWTGNTRWYTYSSVKDTRSNEEWSLQLGNYNGDEYIFVGRISGNYAGGGFGMFRKANAHAVTDEVLCLENHFPGGVVFAGDTGEYCKNLFKGALFATGSTIKHFRLP